MASLAFYAGGSQPLFTGYGQGYSISSETRRYAASIIAFVLAATEVSASNGW